MAPAIDSDLSEMLTSIESNSADTGTHSGEMLIKADNGSVAESNFRATFAAHETVVNGIDVEPDQSMASRIQLTWPGCLLMVWLMGFFALVGQIGWAILLQRRRLDEMDEIDDAEWSAAVAEIAKRIGLMTQGFTTRESTATTVPMTCGALHTVVVVPITWREWSNEHLKCVLSHELAHVKRNDVAIQLFARLIASIYWFNPLVWFAAHRLRVEREFACDDAVLFSGRRPSDYADALLATVRGFRPERNCPGVAMADSARLDKRVEAVLDSGRQRRPLSKSVLSFSVGVAMCVGVAIGGVTLTRIAAQDSSAVANRQLSEMITVHGVVFWAR